MAEGTRIKKLDEKLARHDEHLTELLNNQQDVRNTQTRIQGTLELILDHLTALERAPIEQQPGVGLLSIPADYRPNRLQVVPVRPPKWQLPSFEGHDPKVWIRHHCLKKQLTYLKGESDPSPLALGETEHNPITLETSTKISELPADVGTIKYMDLTVLIDSGSTHSFMDANTVKETSYHINYSPPGASNNRRW
ncbi:hypothetical protein KY284_032627 [Solanum tuberosum]|nr:hypothetical protein KY284_032627 [Solanum tuberosum]